MKGTPDEAVDKLREIKFDTIPAKRVGESLHALEWPRGSTPDYGGVYAFWWRAGRSHLWNTIQNRTVAFHGPGGSEGKLELLNLTKESFTEFDKKVPLYIGKSVNVASRIGQHLMLKTKRAVPLHKGAEKSKRRTTSCQMRDRLDRLFHEMEDPRDLILDNLSLSIVREESWVSRFFLEDLAIGLYRPLFNLDCER